MCQQYMLMVLTASTQIKLSCCLTKWLANARSPEFARMVGQYRPVVRKYMQQFAAVAVVVA